MSSLCSKIAPGSFVHVCNRAIGDDLLFCRKEDFHDWMKRMEKYVVPVAEIHAFCLLPNHYHFILRTLETTPHELFCKQIGNLQSTYCKEFNRINKRKGGLFLSPFNRIPIKDEAHLAWVFWYAHRNPLHHGITENWQDWEYSSYSMYVNGNTRFLHTQFCIDLFGGLEQIKVHHQMNAHAFRLDMRELGLE